MNSGEPRENFADKRIFLSVILAGLLYSAFFSAVCIIKYNAFAYVDFDSAINIQRYWNILHGDGTMPLIGGVTLWGNSLEIIAYPMSVVYFMLFSSPQALLVLRSLIFGATIIPIFLITRKVLPEKWAAGLGISFLLNPALWYINIYEYYDMTFCILPLAFAFYFLKKGNFRWFIFLIVLSVSFRADIALITFMLGVYALMDKKPLKWAITPMLISTLWVIIGVFIIMPMVEPRVRYEAFYGQLGGSFLEVAKNIITQPFLPLKELLIKQNATFLFQVLLPVEFLSVFGLKEFSICFPTMFQHLISSKPLEHTIYVYYTVTLLPFVYISAAYGLAKISSRDGKGPNRYYRIIPVLFIALSLIANLWYGPLSNAGEYISFFRFEDSDIKRAEFVNRIPGDAAVISTFEFTSHLANRRDLYSFHYVTRAPVPWPVPNYRIPDNAEYALVDFLDPETTGYFCDKDSDLRMRSFLDNGGWEVVDSFDSVVMFKKGHTSGPRLFQANASGFDDKKPVIIAGNKLALLNYEFKPEGRLLNMNFYWECLDKTDDDIWLILQIFDENGEEVCRNMQPICYGIYPAYRWSKAEKVVDNYKMILPSRLKDKTEYKLHMILYSKNLDKVLRVVGVAGSEIKDECRFYLGSFRL